jgi:hypothetical protein
MNSTELSSWEVASHSATQEMSTFYGTNESPPLVPILQKRIRNIGSCITIQLFPSLSCYLQSWLTDLNLQPDDPNSLVCSPHNFFSPLALQPNSGLGRLHETFRFTSVTGSRTVGRTPWTGYQLVARSLHVHKHRKTYTQHKH